jgi:hypothetical protein
MTARPVAKAGAATSNEIRASFEITGASFEITGASCTAWRRSLTAGKSPVHTSKIPPRNADNIMQINGLNRIFGAGRQRSFARKNGAGNGTEGNLAPF